jgi:cysteine desulfurase/selenocysteine lyase
VTLWKIVKTYSLDILFVVDASQSVPHFQVDVNKIWCDVLFFTGHKLMADTWIGVLWAKSQLLSSLKPAFSGWGAIAWVKKCEFKSSPTLPDAFEPWTPNLTGAVSLLKACEYIEHIGGYQKIGEMESKLVQYTLEKFQHLQWVRLIGGINAHSRVGVFSFVVEGIHSFDIADYMAEHHICIRAGQHCAEPLMLELWINNTCRMSLYLYNDIQEIDMFFDILKQCILDLR